MKPSCRICAILILVFFISGLFLPAGVMAAGVYIQPKPEGLDIGKTSDGQYNIRYDKYAFKHKVNLTWTQVETDPGVNQMDEGEYGSIQEKGYKIFTSTDNVHYNLYPENITWAPVSGTDPVKVSKDIDSNGNEPLKSGTIYYAYVKAYHRHVKNIGGGNTVETVHESLGSNVTIFMTDLAVKVNPVDSDSVEIVWDDVKYNGMRIDYDIDISQSKDFIHKITYNVRQPGIGASAPVKPVQGQTGQNDKLSFTAKGEEFGMRPGTVYYVKVKPINVWQDVRYRPESEIAVGYTQIIAQMYRMSDQWWRIDWNPITESSLGPDQEILYKIKRGKKTEEHPVLVTISETTDKKYSVSVRGGDYFYIVVAEVADQFGNVIPDGIQSSRQYPVETAIPSNPAVPDIREELRTYYPDGALLYKYTDTANLSPQSATVAWTVPKLQDGSVDNDIVYDLWLLTNPADIGNSNVPKLKSEFKVGSDTESGFIKDPGDNVIAFKYTFRNLNPNRTYYMKLVAKKKFTVGVGGGLVTKHFESEPALKVIITPTGEPIDKPAVNPTLKIKQLNGKDDVNKNSATIQWKNQWREVWDGSKWNYVDPSVSVANAVYRDIAYDDKVKFSIGYAKYQELSGTDGNVNYEKIRNPQFLKVAGIQNNMASIIQEYKLTALEPNTTYVVWMTAGRDNVEPPFEPSDPIIIVTKPDVTVPVDKPTVPRFIFNKPGDTFVDLQWTLQDNYAYYLKYSTTDDIATSNETITITPQDLKRSAVYRAKGKTAGLTPGTVYYFWIQADSTGQKIADGLSLWSDSYSVKTLPYTAPEIPKGFGLKNTPDAVGKNNLTFQWIKVNGLKYIIEYASDINFKDAKEYPSKGPVDAAECNVEGLRSNFRYYVRLYAYDPDKKLRSAPTQSITVRTLRSSDDYDANEDIENVITGPFVTESTSNGVWTLQVTGPNADRLIEKVQSDKVLDYRFDLTTPPANTNKRVLLISHSVFRALANLKESVVIDSGYSQCTIRPGVFDTEQTKRVQQINGNFNVELTLTDDDRVGNSPETGLKYKTKTSNVLVNLINGSETVPLKQLGKPLKMAFLYTDESFLKDESVAGYSYDSDTGKWVKHDVSTRYDSTLKKGYASFDVGKPGKSAIMARTGDFTDIYDDEARSQIMSVAAKFNLKSVNPGSFRPQDNITRGEAVKIVMDILGYDYDDDYAVTAVKAGFTPVSQISDMDAACSRGELLKMIDRLYERVTGKKAEARETEIDDAQPITRSGSVVELYNMLKEIGEL